MCFSNYENVNSFCWTESQISQVKAAFFYGYPFLQVVGGRMAEIIGTRRYDNYSNYVFIGMIFHLLSVFCGK